MRINLYQTLEDRDNPEYVEEFGPFKTSNKTAWLGFGFYFWDTYEELGHWWGATVHNKKYIVCKARCFLDESCWDLHGNGMHRLEFEEICNELIDSGLTSKEHLLVPQIIEFFKQKGAFVYKAIRALGANSISSRYSDNYVFFRFHFKKGNPAFLDLRPPVQVCLIEKRALSLQNYKIVYPYDYIENYA